MHRSKLTTPIPRRRHARGLTLLVLLLALWGLPPSAPAQVVVDDSGKVGIGTTNPTQALDLTGASPQLRVSNKSNPNAHNAEIILSDQGVGGQGAKEYWLGLDTSDYFFVRDMTAAGQPHRFVIAADGKVGIGTTGPAANLHINGRDDVSPSLTLRQANNPAGGYDFDINNSTGLMNLYGNNEGPRQMLMQFNRANGNIGIGFTPLGNILTVAQNSATDPIADAWTTYSSIRWKENIIPFSGALKKIERLRTVYFDWKQTKQRDLGMIAEEVGAVIPEAVAYEENGKDAKSIDYGRLTAFLVAAIKEQQAEIKEQRVAIKAQQAEIRALRQDLSAFQRTQSLSLVVYPSH